MSTSRIVNENPDVYYQGSYWNDYPYVVEQLNIKISGDLGVFWPAHFQQFCGKTFKKALILRQQIFLKQHICIGKNALIEKIQIKKLKK